MHWADSVSMNKRMTNPHHYLSIVFWLVLLVSGAGHSAFGQEGVYQDSNAFLTEAFEGMAAPKAGVYSLTQADQGVAKAIFGASYQPVRVRYWRSGDRTAWILHWVGKTKPITAGFVVDKGKSYITRVLVYRESHGAEVRNSFFTKRFKGAELEGGKKYELDQRIHNVAGATMSVDSMREMARFALYLHGRVVK